MRSHHLRIVLWSALFLLLLETGLEIRARNRGYETLLFGADPHEWVASHPGYGPSEAWPFRSRLPDGNALARVWLASGSYLDDARIAPDLNGASLLDAYLGSAVLVVNNSRAGWDIRRNTLTLLQEPEATLPLVAVLYQLTNDLTSIAETTEELALPDKQAISLSDRVTGLVQKTTLYAHLQNQITCRLLQAQVLSDGLGDESAARFEDRVRYFIEACHSRGVTPVVATLGRSYGGVDPTMLRDDERQHMFLFVNRLSPLGWLRTIQAWNDILRQIAAEEGVLLIDMDRAMSGNRTYFRDFTHFTPKGHRFFSEQVGQVLLEMPVLDRRLREESK